MKNQQKLILALTGAAVLMAGTAMTAFAERGWVNEGNVWYYYDNSGDPVTDRWKTYNGNYFYLGDEGIMLTNELIEDGNNYYYVDANGAMVRNTWVAVAADEDEELDVDYRWYYFGSNGKAFKNADKKSIDGKKYGFDEEGKMLFGYVEDRTILDREDPILYADHYYGGPDDGAMHTGWLKYEDALSGNEYDDEYYWFWFNSKGEKYNDPTKTKKINGQTYAFDENGIMQKEWTVATVGGTEGWAWFNAESDGHLQKNSWIWANEEDITGKDNDRWWYADKNGVLVKDQVKKINGKYYAFDSIGRMKFGLVWLDKESAKAKDAKIVTVQKIDETSADQIYGLAEIKDGKKKWSDITTVGYLHFFSDNEKKDGSMKTGTVKVDLYDDLYTMGFDKTTGCAYDGVEKNKVYRQGILQTAGDDKYAVKNVPDKDGNDRLYLVSTSGTMMKKGSTCKDDNDDYYYVEDGSAKEGFDIYVADTAKAARGEEGSREKVTAED